MTHPFFLDDAYRREATARVTAYTPERGIVVDGSVFYPTGGGQPGDSGHILWDAQSLRIDTAQKHGGTQVVLMPDPGAALPPVGTTITQVIDWDRRFAHMRMHTALHLLSVVIPLPVSGGAIGVGKGRLDFNMAEPPADKAALEKAINDLVARDLPVTESWITPAGLRANPGLVKTMSVAPPEGQDRIRLVRIGEGADQVDLQPCGGTHVARTAEIGRLRLGKIEKKGRQNRRVYLHVDG